MLRFEGQCVQNPGLRGAGKGAAGGEMLWSLLLGLLRG